jgi:hypothetical protein
MLLGIPVLGSRTLDLICNSKKVNAPLESQLSKIIKMLLTLQLKQAEQQEETPTTLRAVK